MQISRPNIRQAGHRDGSTLLIVIALLSLLMFMGFVFYTFAAQEQTSAEYFAEAHKEVIEEPIEFFDFGLRQLIMGPHEQFETQSALYGNRHAMAWNMLGTDLSPGSSSGLKVGYVGGNASITSSGDNADLINFNDSPTALGRRLRPYTVPQGDVSYNRPDINTLFLAFHDDVFQVDGTNRVHVSIPSFHRPQYLNGSNGKPSRDWYIDPLNAGRVFRPHPDHVVVNANGDAVVDGSNNRITRFVSNDTTDPGFATVGAFPFKPPSVATGLAHIDGEQGIFTQTTPDDPATTTVDESTFVTNPLTYELDVNNINPDAPTRNAVWLDLAHTMLETSDGQNNYVPLFSFTVLDCDALLNLNIHGNIHGYVGNAEVGVETQGVFQREGSRSTRQGVGGPADINPLYGMHKEFASLIPMDPTDPSQANHLTKYFGHAPQSYREARNMEWWFLNVGRPEYATGSTTIKDLHEGRYGELRLLYEQIQAGTPPGYNNGFPGPGITNLDDNENRFEGWGTFGLSRYVHPLDYTGRGQVTLTGRWPQYVDYQQPADTNVFATEVWPNYGAYAGNTMAQPTRVDYTLLDDPLEITVDPEFEQRPQDSILSAKDMPWLYLSKEDLNGSIGSEVSDRIAMLAPHFFDKEDEDGRGRFTAMSWARNQFLLSRDGRTRTHEFEVGDRFPPIYGSVRAYSDDDPFRTPVRRLLEVHEDNRNSFSQQMPLSVNHIVDVQRNRQGRGDEMRGRLVYRNLTTHPTTNLTVSSIATAINNTLPNYPPQTVGEQEFWARRDRQQLCRDIYVCLYTFCAVGTTPTAIERKEMAQFAVNMVDAMDADSVITRFEYDIDLSDGWNLDDNSDTSTHQITGASETAQRESVLGIERQELVINEGLVIRQSPYEDATNNQTDSPLTAHIDNFSDADRLFWLYLELRSLTPFPVNLSHQDDPSTNAPNDGVSDPKEAIWRIRRTDTDNQLTFLKGAGSVPANGGVYTIGSADREVEHRVPATDPTAEPDIRPSYIFGELRGSNDKLELIAPKNTTGQWPSGGIDANTPTSDYINLRLLDLDLIRTDFSKSANRVLDRDEVYHTKTNNALLGDFAKTANDHNTGITFVLERRMNPHLPALPDSTNDPSGIVANDWVAVDRFTVTGISDLEFTAANETNFVSKCNQLVSYTRSNTAPFTRTSTSHATGSLASSPPSNSRPANSLGDAVQTAYQWQIHHDRDYASVGELLTTPLFGPTDVTSSNQLIDSYRANSTTTPPADDQIAAFKFFANDGSRWRRMFGLFNVPTRVHRQLGSPLDVVRVPGKININMIRHPEVLAALMDAPQHVFEEFAQTVGPDAYKTLQALRHRDVAGTSLAQNWWQDFLKSRDNAFPHGGQWYYVPGVPHVPIASNPNPKPGKPFRALLEATDKDETIFRVHPDYDNATGHRRRLFELGEGTTLVDIDERYKLLTKMAGNVSTRSNVFVVFATVGFFKAYQDSATGAVRIGERLHREGTDVPEKDFVRAVFILDRSAFEDYAFDGDWKKVVKHTQILQD